MEAKPKGAASPKLIWLAESAAAFYKSGVSGSEGKIANLAYCCSKHVQASSTMIALLASSRNTFSPRRT